MSYGVGLRNGVAFALGTIPSLTSGGGLRPSLLLNFLSGTLDSRITFSRGTQATQYTSNGTLQYAPNNLLTYSNQADNAAWTKSNSFVQTNLRTWSQDFTNVVWTKNSFAVKAVSPSVTTAPDGTSTATLIYPTVSGVVTAVRLLGSVSVATATAYTASCYVKSAGKQWVYFSGPDASSTALDCWFDVVNGVVGTKGASVTTATITSVGNGWYRLSTTSTSTSLTNYVFVSTTDANGSSTVTASGNSGIYIWGAQLVQGSVPGDYVATTSAALPVLYADYQGKLRARKLCENATTGTHYILQNATVVGGAINTDSIYVKAGERTSCRFINYDNAANYAFVYVDLTNGTISNSGVTGTVSNQTFTVTPAGNGWYRIAVSALIAATTRQVRIDTAVGASENTTGDGSSGIYIADAQLEAGSTVQAYNDTTSAAYYGPRFDYDPTNYVRQNLALYSEQFDNAAWNAVSVTTTANTTIAPDGTLTADSLAFAAGTAYKYQNATVGNVNGKTYTFSCWLWTTTGKASIGIRICGNSTGADQAFSNVVLSTTPTRVSITRTFTSSDTIIDFGFDNRVAQGGDGLAGTVVAWGAQLNTGSTALTYTATTTAPYTLCAARGLLIEEQRANLLLQSNDFQTSWLLTNITRTLGDTTGPDGTLSGVKIAATAGAGGFSTQLRQAAAVAATSATGSVYVKQGTGATTANEFLLRNSTTATDLIAGTLNYSTGVFTYTTGSTGVVVTNVGNGWWRIAITATAGITSGDSVLLYVGWVGAAATAGQFLYAYGAQLEAGAFATSYIPTVGSQVTRAADSASITTLTPWYNSAQGTLFASVSYEAAANGPVGDYNVSISDGTISNIILIGSAGSVSCQLISGGVSSYNQGVGTRPAIGVVQKTAFAYSAVDANQAVNGTLGTTDTTTVVPSAVTKLSIGSRGDNSGYLNGWVNTLNYYPTRLPNATLQGLTV